MVVLCEWGRAERGYRMSHEALPVGRRLGDDKRLVELLQPRSVNGLRQSTICPVQCQTGYHTHITKTCKAEKEMLRRWDSLGSISAAISLLTAVKRMSTNDWDRARSISTDCVIVFCHFFSSSASPPPPMVVLRVNLCLGGSVIQRGEGGFAFCLPSAFY